MIEIGADLIIKFALVLALGGLVGFERERRHKEAGVRTFILIAATGFLTAFLSEVFGSAVFLVMLAGAMVLASLSYHDHIYRKSHIGLTTVFAMVVMFFTGVIGYFDAYPPFITVAMGIILALILASREYLHKFAHKLKNVELMDGILFAVFAFVILPLLPKTAIDPWGIFKPFYIWLFMVFILGLNFASYIVMKMLGPKLGLELTGILGGLISSTSVAASMATKISRNKSLMSVGSFAASIASSIVFIRIPIIMFILNPAVGLALILPMSIIAVIGIIASFMLLDNGRSRINPDLGSPLELKPALRFGAAFVFVLIIVNFVQRFFGDTGTYIASFVSGLTDVDAISLSLTTLFTSGSIGIATVVIAIMVAALSNTLFKWFIIHQAGGNEMFRYVARSFVPIIIAALVMIFLVANGILPLLGNL